MWNQPLPCYGSKLVLEKGRSVAPGPWRVGARRARFLSMAEYGQEEVANAWVLLEQEAA